ncbi:MAG: HAD family phosphatase [Phreatobacter sp.]|nr:HAD family phosphatase [Phreatobacter sp.]
MSRFSPVPVFDIGQVLLQWQPRASLQRHFEDDEAIDAFMTEVGFMDWHTRQDAGRPVTEAVEEHAARFPHHAAVFAAFYDDWLRSVPGEVPGTRAIFEGLAARGPVYGISNFSRELFDRTVPAYPFLGAFAGLVLSGDVGINKPDPRIYAILCERHGLDPAACVFIDDSERNVQVARAYGMAAVHFTDAASLSASLRDRGLAW